MGFVDKLKNIFFEEEEEEEIEDTRPLRKMREKEKKELASEKAQERETQEEIIAKKVELPKRKREVVEQSENVEEIKYEAPRRTRETPKEYEEIEKETIAPPKKEQPKISNMIFDDEDFLLSDIKPKEETKKEEKTYRKRDTYPEREIREKEAPTYEYKRREEAKPRGFTPSPIISPIYGILDKNYKKEEVKEKKEIRLTSRVDRLDLDSVRNKAFGDLENDLFPGSIDEEKSEIPRQDINKIKEDMEDDGKPVVDKVTLGEADEYYSDLGLAYNTDYKDISKEINDGKVKSKKEKEGRLEDNLFDLIEKEYDRED